MKKGTKIGLGILGVIGIATGYYFFGSARRVKDRACERCKEHVIAGDIQFVNKWIDSPCMECAEVAESSMVSSINNLAQRAATETDSVKRSELQAQIADYPNQLALLKQRASAPVAGYFL
jgi:hypothetical protein